MGGATAPQSGYYQVRQVRPDLDTVASTGKRVRPQGLAGENGMTLSRANRGLECDH